MASFSIKSIKWQNLAVLVLHGLFLIGSSLALYIWRSQNNLATDGQNDLAIAFGAGVVVTLFLAVSAFVTSLNKAFPYILVIGDWALAGVYLNLAQSEPMLVVSISSALILIGVLRLGMMWGTLHLIGVVAIALGLLVSEVGADALGDQVDAYSLPFMTIILLSLIVGGWVFVRDRYVGRQLAQLNSLTEASEDAIVKARERVNAVTEMTYALSSTLNYERILTAALDIGSITVRDKANHRMAAMVLLFRSQDEALYIASSRGLFPMEDQQILKGKAGIIPKALEEGKPIIIGNASQDPELKQFNTFRGMHSIMCVPLRAHYDNYGVLIFGSKQANAFNADHIDIVDAVGIQATLALQNAVLYKNLMDEKERIIQMEEDARKSLVRDLHDIPTQTVSAVAMRIRIIMRLLERNPEEVPEELKVVEEMTLRATEEMRHVLFKLRPLALESQGLAAALDQLAQKMEKTYKQPMTVKVSPAVEHYLDQSQQGALFYLIEEACNNARKYAQANLISVQGVLQGDTIAIRIADNGVGFDTEAVNASYDNRGSFGMVNMRERAELLDGTLSLESTPGQGTVITVMIPIDREKTDPFGETVKRPEITTTKLASVTKSSLDNGS